MAYQEVAADATRLWTGRDTRQVGLWPRIFRVMDVDSAKQTCTLKLVLISKWLDLEFARKLAHDGWTSAAETWPGVKGAKGDTRTFFENPGDAVKAGCSSVPILRFESATSAFDVSVEFMWVNPEGVCHWERWGTLTIASPMDAGNFPFDYVDVIVDLRLKRDFTRPDRYLCTERMHTNEEAQNRIHICTNNASIPEWEICLLDGKPPFWVKTDQMSVTPLVVESNLRSGWLASYRVLFVLRRRPNYYILNIWSLLMVFSLLALTTFALDPTDIGSRQSSLLTLLFVQLAAKFAFADSLPKLPYLTTLDYKVYSSVFLVTMLLVAQSALPKAVNADDLSQADKILLFVWIFVLVVWEVTFWIISYCRQAIQKGRVLEAARKFQTAPGDIVPVAIACKGTLM